MSEEVFPQNDKPYKKEALDLFFGWDAVDKIQELMVRIAELEAKLVDKEQQRLEYVRMWGKAEEENDELREECGDLEAKLKQAEEEKRVLALGLQAEIATNRFEHIEVDELLQEATEKAKEQNDGR